MKTAKRFTINEAGTNVCLLGFRCIPKDNAVFTFLDESTIPVDALKVGESTTAYFRSGMGTTHATIVREEDA